MIHKATKSVGASRRWGGLLLAALLSLSAGCGDDGAPGAQGPEGPEGPQGPPGDPGQPGQDADYDLPGANLVITAVGGGTGAGGNLVVGNFLSVTFTLKDDRGNDLDLTQFSSGSIYVSGPTTNYNRVIASQSDLRTRSVNNGNGTWTYTFAVPIPAAYIAPLNDSPTFGPLDGELTGQPLENGTYTVGVQTYKTYTIDDQSFRDTAVDVEDFLFGTATVIDTHEIVTNANCNVCHTELRAHGESRIDVRLCVLCHTSGSEDKNVPTVEGGTPGVSIDFKVMIHQIHNAKHLPSVQGVGVTAAGDKDYTVAPKPLKYVGYNNNVDDLSDIAFPVWPSLNIAHLRDTGYSLLVGDAKTKEDAILLGAVACAKCHGDPDGPEPLPAPIQGGLHETVPTRQACGACHNDIDWTKPYRSNGQEMPANLGNASCANCHTPSGTALSVRDAHLHPILNPAYNPGLSFNVTSVAGVAGTTFIDNGRIDPGEKVAITFTITDGSGVAVAPTSLNSTSLVISGPTSNYNLLLSSSIPNAHPSYASGPPYTIRAPQSLVFEFVGTGSGAAGEVFTTVRTPHLNVTGATTTVRIRSAPATPGDTTTVEDAARFQNFLDVGSVTNFARDDYVVIDDGGAAKEFSRVALVDGNRLWLTSALRNVHGAGAAVLEVTLTSRTAGTHYNLTAATGTITETGAGTNLTGDVVVDYWTDFILPDVYPPTLNDSPDLGEEFGEWTGKSIVSGTYTLDLWGYINRVVALHGESQTYRGTSEAGAVDFLVGDDATAIEPYDLISESKNCYACHDDLYFHGGGRRSFVTCIVCHAAAGAEDRPRYTAGSAPATPKVSISFREMLHKIHMGKELPDAETYTVVGYGAAGYPNNFTPHTYEEVGFPAMPDGVKQCDKCHGNDAWKEPSDRAHPTEQDVPVRNWGIVCNSCHSSESATAHIQSQTWQGLESCGVCHAALRTAAVEEVHKPR
jgi:OmcA/MtrC family decaheme c-type cytochrome